MPRLTCGGGAVRQILHQLALRPDVEDSAELLRRSLESFYLTLDRLRDPGASDLYTFPIERYMLLCCSAVAMVHV